MLTVAILSLAFIVLCFRNSFHTHARCLGCNERRIPIIGPWFGVRRRAGVYCPDCLPEEGK